MVKENLPSMFENDVKMYGTQAIFSGNPLKNLFENDVKMYGTQAFATFTFVFVLFENDVKMYGTQAETYEIMHEIGF